MLRLPTTALILPLLITTLFLSLQSSSAGADTVYIRDVIYVPLRGGQSGEHRILHQGIRSGTVLERLEVNDETGFSLVRTASGLEGWIQNQYLVTDPIARDQLEALREKLARLESTTTGSKAQLEIELEKVSAANQLIENLEQEKSALNQELSRITALAADVINIEAKNIELQEEFKGLNQQIDDLTVVNADLQDENNQTWYMIGAATIFFGILLGLWLGRKMFGRRDAGWG